MNGTPIRGDFRSDTLTVASHAMREAMATAEAFDPQQNRWEAVAPMAQERHSFAVAAL